MVKPQQVQRPAFVVPFSGGTRLIALDLRNDTSRCLKPVSQARKTPA